MKILKKLFFYTAFVSFFVLPNVSFAQQEEELNLIDRISIEVFCFFQFCDDSDPQEELNEIGPIIILPTTDVQVPTSPNNNVSNTNTTLQQTVVQNVTNNPVIERTIEKETETITETTFLSQEEVDRLEDLIKEYFRKSNRGDSDNQDLSFDTATNILSIDSGDSVDLSSLLGGGGGGGAISDSGSVITFTDGLGATTSVDIADLETLTTLSASGTILSYVDEDGATTTIDLSTISGSSTDEFNTALTFASTTNTISSTDGGGVLTTIIDALSNITLLGTTVADIFTANTATITDLTSTNATTTNLSITNTLLDSDGDTGNPGDVLSYDGTNLDWITPSTFSDTDAQVITLVGDTLTLSAGTGATSTVDLSGYYNSGLTFASTTGVLSLTDGSSTIDVDLSELQSTETLTLLTSSTTAGTLSYIDELGATTTIDIAAIIAEQETLTTLTDNGDGTFDYIDEDGATTTIDTNVTDVLTTLSTTTDSLVYVDELGATTTIAISDLETLTSVTNLLAGGNSIGDYIDEDGATTTIFETITGLTTTGQTFSYVAEDGATTTIDITALETTTTITDNGDGTFAYIDEDGATTTIDTNVADIVTLLGSTTDSIFYVDELGATTTIAIADLETTIGVTNLLTAGNQIATIEDEDGGFFNILETITSTTLDTLTGLFSFVDESGATTTLDFATTIDNLETLTTLTDNGDGTFDYIDEDGATTTIDTNVTDVLTTLSTTTDSLVYVDELGATTTIAISDLETLTSVTNLLAGGNSIGDYIDEDGATTTIFETITGLTTTGQTFSYVAEDGATTTIDITALETTTTITDNGDGTFAYIDEDGATTTIDTNVADIVTILGSTTDSIFYVDELGATTTIAIADLETTIGVTNLLTAGNQIATIEDEDGGFFNILETITSTTLDTLTGLFSFVDESGATTTLDFATTIDNLETLTTLTDNGDGTFDYIDEDGATTTIDTNVTDVLTTLSTTTDSLVYVDELGATTTIAISDLETLTSVTNLLAGGNSIGDYIDEDGATTTIFETITGLTTTGQTFSYVAEDGATTTIDITALETTTTITDNGDGTFAYIDEDGATTTIDTNVADIVTILGSTTDSIFYVDELGATTTIAIADLETTIGVTNLLTAGNQIATIEDEDGGFFNILETITSTTLDTLTGLFSFVDESGATTTLDFATTIDNLETVTTLTDNGDGTFDYIDEDGATTTIDTNVTDVLTTLSTTTDSLVYVDELGATTTIAISDLETLTSVTNLLAGGNSIGDYIDEDGATTTIFETITGLTTTGQTFSYVAEDGATTTIDITALETTTTITDNGDGTFDYIDEDGATTTIDTNVADIVTLLGSTTDSIFYVDELGATTTIAIADLETTIGVTNLLTAGNQIATIEDEDGGFFNILETITSTTLDTLTGLFSFVDESGATTTLDFATTIDNLETVTTLTDNGDGTFDYIDEDGATTTIDTNVTDVLTTLSTTTDSLVYVDELGATTTIAISDLETLTSVTNLLAGGNSIGDYIDEDGATTTIFETITGLTTTGQTFSYVAEDGATTTIDITALETTTTITDNGDGTFAYIDEDGATTTIDTNVADIVTILGSTTDSIFYVDELGATTTIAIADLETTIGVTNLLTAGNQIATIEDEDGGFFNILETITSTTLDTLTGLFSFVDESGATTTLDFATTIDNLETVTTLTDNGDGTFDYIDEDGATTTIDTNVTDVLTTLSTTTDSLVYVDELGATTTIAISDLETLTSVTNLLAGGNSIGDYIDEDGATTTIFETITGLTTTGQTFSYVAEDGATTTIDITALETTTTITDNGDGTFAYIDEDGATTTIDTNVADIVTILGSTTDSIFYVDELGATTTIAIADLETTIGVTNLLTAGNQIATIEDEDGGFFNILETITSTTLDTLTGLFSFVDESGATTTLDFATTIDNLETVTTLTDNGDGTFDYIDEDGATTTIDTNVTDVLTTLSTTTDSLVYVDELGATTTIAISDLETLTSVTNLLAGGNSIGDYIDEDGATTTIFETITGLTTTGQTFSYVAEDGATTTIDITALETTTTITDNGDGTFAYIDEDGATTTIDTNVADIVTLLGSTTDSIFYVDELGATTTIAIADLETTIGVTNLLTAGNQIATIEDEDGGFFNILETITSTTLDTLTGLFSFVDESGATTTLDFATTIDNLETLTTLTDNGDGTFDYIDEDGATTTIDTNVTDVLTTLSTTTDSLVYVDELGATTTIAISDLETLTSVTNLLAGGNSIGDYIDEDGATTTIFETITGLTTTGQTFSYVAEDGATTTIDITALETTTTITDNGDGTFAYIDEDGATTTIDTNVADIVTILGSTTDSIFYVDELGATTTIAIADLETTIGVTNLLTAGNQIATIEDEDGGFFNILETITSTTLDTLTGLFSFVDESGATTTLDFATTIDNLETVTTLTDNGDGTFDYIDEDGATTTIDTNVTDVLTTLSTTTDSLVYVDELGATTTIAISDLETLTSVTNLLAGGNSIGDYIDEDGATTTIFETITGLTTTGQTFSYVAEDGATTTIDITALETTTTITDNGDGTFAYIDEDGATTTIDTNVADIVTILGSTTDSIFYVDELGATTTIAIADLETTIGVTNLLTAGNQIATIEDEDGGFFNILETITSTTLDTLTGLFSFVDESGATTTLDFATTIDNLETVTTLTDNGDGTFDYIDEDGATTTIDTNVTDVLTTLSTTTDSLVYVDELGATTTIAISDLETLTSVTNLLAGGNSIGDYIDEDGATTTIFETITGLTTTGQTFSYVAEDGATTTIDITALETTTTITDNGDGTFAYIDEDGATTTIDTNVADIVTILGSTTDSIFYVDELGATTTIAIADLETTIGVTNLLTAGNQIATIEDEDGGFFNILETITSTTLDTLTGLFSFVDESGATTTLDFATTIDNLETLTTLTDNGDGTFDYIDEDGATTTIDTNVTDVLTTLSTTTDSLVYVDELGATTTIAVNDLVDQYNQTFTFATTTNQLDIIDSSSTLSVLLDEFNAITLNGTTTSENIENSGNIITNVITAVTGFFTNLFATTATIDNLTATTTVTDTLTVTTPGTGTTTDNILVIDPTTGEVKEIPAGTLVSDLETLTTLSTTTGALVYIDELGATTTISISDLETLTTVTDTIALGNIIGTYTDEDGATTSILETITSLSASGTDLLYLDEDGATTTITLDSSPWFGIDDDTSATDNTEDIYLLADVAVGVATSGTRLFVQDNIAGGGATTSPAELVAIGTVDSDNTSTLDARVIDNNYGNLVYNNSSAGSANKSLPGINLGSALAVETIRVYWWNNTYTSSNYNIQGSADGTTWTNVSTGNDSTGLGGTFQDITVSTTFQYWRVFNVTGTNATWVVISELEAFDAGTVVGSGTVVAEVYNANNTSDVDLIRLSSDVAGVQNVKFRVDSDGDVYSDGTSFLGGGADLAEAYKNNDGADRGDVVAFIDIETVAKAATTSGSTIAGVVSSDPGLVLNFDQNDPNLVPIALVGQVPVNFSDVNGDVVPGDFLVAGANGTAVKAIGDGYVIGTALESSNGPFPLEMFVNPGYRSEQVLTNVSASGTDLLYVDEDGATTTINIADLETTTTLLFDGTDLLYVDEDGATTTLSIGAVSSSTDEFNTNLSFSSTTNTISSTDGGGVLTTVIDALTNIALLGTTVMDIFTANTGTITNLTATTATTTDLFAIGNSTLATTTITGPLDLGFTTGSVLFDGVNGVTEDNATFFWDETNNRLGLGTDTPNRNLDIYGGTGVAAISFQNDDTGSGFVDGGFLGLDASENLSFFNYENTDLILGTNAADYLFIKPSGNIGVGTSTPSDTLTIEGDISVTGTYRDSLGDVGAAGQVLSSTLTGTDWIDTTAFTEDVGNPSTAGYTGTSTGDWYKDTSSNLYYVWDGLEWEQITNVGAQSCVLGGATIQGSNGNVLGSTGIISGATRDAAGKYTVNFSQTLVVNDYVALITTHDEVNPGSSAIVTLTGKNTTNIGVDIQFGDNGGVDDVDDDENFEVIIFDLTCDTGTGSTTTSIADGTATGSTLYWDGSSWNENLLSTSDGAGNATSTTSFYTNLVTAITGTFTDLTVTGDTNLASTTISQLFLNPITAGTTTDQILVRDATTGEIKQIAASDISHEGTTGSVFFAGSDGKPTEDNTNFFWDDTNDKLGIGTTNPIRSIEIFGESATTGIGFTNSVTGTTTLDGLGIGIDASQDARLLNFENTDMIFSTNNIKRLWLKADGNLGVGTSTPAEALSVDGNLFVTGEGTFENLTTGTSTDQLVTIDANGLLHRVDRSDVLQTPWNDQVTKLPATANTDDVYTLGNVGIGTDITNSITGFNYNSLEFWDDTGAFSDFTQVIGGGGWGVHNIITHQGSSTTRTIVLDDQNLGEFHVGAYDGTTFGEASRILTQVDGVPGAGDLPSRLTFWTTAAGTSTATERLRITNDGRVAINTTDPATARLALEDTEDSEFIRLSDSTNADSAGIYAGAGSPETAVVAQLGSIYTDHSTGNLYIKQAGDGLNTGWVTYTPTTTGTTTATSSNSGLEVTDGGLSLLRGCADDEILKWDATASVWECASDRSTYHSVTTADYTNNTAVLTDVADMSFPIGANEDWYFEMWLQTDGDSQDDLRARVNCPAGATGDWSVFERESHGSQGNLACGATSNSIGLPNAAESAIVQGLIQNTATSGTVQLQLRENAANDAGNALTVYAGSVLQAWKLSGADYAEVYFADSDNVIPGTIVQIHPTIDAGVMLANTNTAQSAIGIISTDPGTVVGAANIGNEGRPVPVALSGRVPLLVTDQNGPINPGDKITVSTTKDGYGMRATDSGYTVGTAISSFDGSSSEGTVVVFVENQWFPGISDSENDINLVSGEDLDEELELSGTTIFDRILNGLEQIWNNVTSNTKALFDLQRENQDLREQNQELEERITLLESFVGLASSTEPIVVEEEEIIEETSTTTEDTTESTASSTEIEIDTSTTTEEVIEQEATTTEEIIEETSTTTEDTTESTASSTEIEIDTSTTTEEVIEQEATTTEETIEDTVVSEPVSDLIEEQEVVEDPIIEPEPEPSE